MSTNLATQLPGSTVETYLSNSSLNSTTGELNIILGRSTVANLPTGAGYAVGCLIQASDTGNNYVNKGTTAAASFILLDSGTAFGLPSSATDATTTTGDSFLLTQSTLTSGNGIRVLGTTGTFTTGGALFKADFSAAVAGNGFVGTTTGIYTGTGMLLLTASSATTGVIAGIVTTSSKALIIGQAAATPAFQVDASTSSQIAGLKVTGAATGGTVAIAAIDSGADASLSINGKGAGTIAIGSVSTGVVTITPATTITGLATLTGGFTSVANAILKSGTAVPATAGAVAAGAPITLYSGGITIELTSDAPTHSRNKGSICINTGGSSSSTRLYVNNGTTTWIAITTAS